MSNSGKVIKIEQIGSPIRRHHSQRETLIGLGLNRIGRVVELPDTPQNLGLTGDEVVDIRGLADLRPGGVVNVTFTREGAERVIEARVRVDTQAELHYFREGGILPAVVREMTRA